MKKRAVTNFNFEKILAAWLGLECRGTGMSLVSRKSGAIDKIQMKERMRLTPHSKCNEGAEFWIYFVEYIVF